VGREISRNRKGSRHEPGERKGRVDPGFDRVRAHARLWGLPISALSASRALFFSMLSAPRLRGLRSFSDVFQRPPRFRLPFFSGCRPPSTLADEGGPSCGKRRSGSRRAIWRRGPLSRFVSALQHESRGLPTSPRKERPEAKARVFSLLLAQQAKGKLFSKSSIRVSTRSENCQAASDLLSVHRPLNCYMRGDGAFDPRDR